jgi:hypothetical protein
MDDGDKSGLEQSQSPDVLLLLPTDGLIDHTMHLVASLETAFEGPMKPDGADRDRYILH